MWLEMWLDNDMTTSTDLLEDFVDNAAAAGLWPTDDAFNLSVDNWIEDQGWMAGRNNGDSYTLARLVESDERIDLTVTTVNGVTHIYLSFPATRLGFRMFQECAAVYP